MTVAINDDAIYIPGVNFTDVLAGPPEPALGHTLVYTQGGVLYAYTHGGTPAVVGSAPSLTENLLAVGGSGNALTSLAAGGTGAVPTRQADGTIAEIVPTDGGGGDLTKIDSHTVPSGGEASATFTAIPGTFSQLRLYACLRCDRSGIAYDLLLLQVNADTGANYDYSIGNDQNGAYVSDFASDSDTSITLGYVLAATAPANQATNLIVELPWYASTTFLKTFRVESTMRYGSSNLKWDSVGFGQWLNTAAITSITIKPATGGVNLVEGSSLALYGLA